VVFEDLLPSLATTLQTKIGSQTHVRHLAVVDAGGGVCAGLCLSRLHHERVDGDGGTLLMEIDGNRVAVDREARSNDKK
jgi:predicted thioesterase